MSTQLSEKDHDSFVTGFTIGLLTSAVGYLLITTERGKEIRRQLTNELVAVIESSPDGDTSTGSKGWLRQTLQTFFLSVFEGWPVKDTQGVENQLIAKSKAKSSKRKSSPPSSSARQAKFKGV